MHKAACRLRRACLGAFPHTAKRQTRPIVLDQEAPSLLRNGLAHSTPGKMTYTALLYLPLPSWIGPTYSAIKARD